ncbi:MAG: MBOAT family protein [Fibrella sp.]|nr:MBOAT family protein [Armatimonadota bacterium]
MIFNTFYYFFVFLLPASLLFRRASDTLRPWILALSGAIFFIYFSLTTVGGALGAWCLLVILWQSLCCLYLCKKNSPACILVIVQSVLFLCAFKYLNFFGGVLFGKPQNSPWYWEDAFLPLGISFFTFEFIHYAADVYSGKTEQPKLGSFLAFILFFPTMVAGPIKRIQDFLPKLENPSRDVALDWQRGITRILVGLVKKFAVADLLTALTNHLNASDIEQVQHSGTLLVWIFAYGIKIYFDFSAYSDIAIGSARLFGIKVPENFDAPYAQTNIALFWRHWHISLSKWLTEYVYFPLGGSRVAAGRVYVNLCIVMLVSGIWHGAGINFLVWGAWHALLLCVHRLWTLNVVPYFKDALETGGPAMRTAVQIASWAATFVSVNLGWAFFAMDFATALRFFQRLFLG